MFPVERKNEYLRYVMITKPYDGWSNVVYGYIKENNINNWKEGFDFVINYSYDPLWHAYFMTKHGYAKSEWAMKVIENVTIGDPSWVAYRMVKCGHAEPEWAIEVIENDTIGNQSVAAYCMVRDGYATQEWLEEIEVNTHKRKLSLKS